VIGTLDERPSVRNEKGIHDDRQHVTASMEACCEISADASGRGIFGAGFAGRGRTGKRGSSCLWWLDGEKSGDGLASVPTGSIVDALCCELVYTLRWNSCIARFDPMGLWP
jgi:hypothetical protein